MRLPHVLVLASVIFSALLVLEYMVVEPLDAYQSNYGPSRVLESTDNHKATFIHRNNTRTTIQESSIPRINDSRPKLPEETSRFSAVQSLDDLRKQRDDVTRQNLRQQLLTEAQTTRNKVPPSGHLFRRGNRPIEHVEVVDLGPSNLTEHRVIYFLHIHKSAGSTMCIGARENGLVVADTNCNVQADQRCCGGSDSLQAQRAFALTTDKEFVANEQDMYEAMDPVNYRYAVTLRQSRDRYFSHWQHVVRVLYPAFTDTFSMWWQGQPDNWNFRKICGSRCMHIPKFQISRDIFAYTVKKLLQFDDILLFESFNESYQDFAHKVGWTKMPRSKGGRKKPVIYPALGDSWDPMMSALDDALYSISGAIRGGEYTYGKVDSAYNVSSVERYFATAESRGDCETPCCWTCSPY